MGLRAWYWEGSGRFRGWGAFALRGSGGWGKEWERGRVILVFVCGLSCVSGGNNEVLKCMGHKGRGGRAHTKEGVSVGEMLDNCFVTFSDCYARL